MINENKIMDNNEVLLTIKIPAILFHFQDNIIAGVTLVIKNDFY